MSDFVHTFLASSWEILWNAAPYIVLGLLLGGLIKTTLNANTIKRHLGGTGFTPVLKAALLGMPLPLCSCSVLPVGAALRKEGASRGATAAFLIATPESGVDSIAISYALLDPILTIFRPLAAFCTAFVAGTGMIFLDRNQAAPQPFQEALATCPCCASSENGQNHSHNHSHGHDCCGESDKEAPSGKLSLGTRLKQGFRYATEELWGHLAFPFAVGILLSGLLGTLVPENFLERWMGGGLHAMLIMLLAGIPMYICATSSTPLAAALILKGVSPGAALVFLLAGPATNLSALPVLLKILGKKGVALYLGSIAILSTGAGILVDWIYRKLQMDPQALMGAIHEILPWEIHGASLLFLGACTISLIWHRFGKLREAEAH